MPLYQFFLLRDGEPVEDVERHLGDDLEALEGAWAATMSLRFTRRSALWLAFSRRMNP